MDVILRKSTLLPFSSQEKIVCAHQRFDIKAAINSDDSKIFSFTFACCFFIVTGKYFLIRFLHIQYPILQVKEWFLSLSFRRYDVF